MEPDIIDTFYEFGFEVLEYTKEVTDKNYLPGKAVREVSAVLQENPCDIAFSINFFPFLSDVCNIFHIRYVSWTVDSPVMELYSKQIKNEWNRTFIFDKADFDDVSPFNPGHIFHLPLGANTGKKEILFSHQSIPNIAEASVNQYISQNLKSKGEKFEDMGRWCNGYNVGFSNVVKNSDIQKFSHDVAFVGSLYSEKCPYDKLSPKAPASLRGYLDGIMAAQERVYGYYFIDELLSDEVVEEFKNTILRFIMILLQVNYLQTGGRCHSFISQIRLRQMKDCIHLNAYLNILTLRFIRQVTHLHCLKFITAVLQKH